jgi:predicted MFS family arabinose efflux permease
VSALSDRIGRKPVIVFGLLVFAVGSGVAALAHTIEGIMIGRAIQGAGAISGALSALLADNTRAEVRTTAMAVYGAGMGLAFTLAMPLGPIFDGLIGVNGIFGMTGLLSLIGIGFVLAIIPTVPRAAATRINFENLIGDPQLLRLDGGIFCLHMMMTCLFVAAPVAIEQSFQLQAPEQWKFYLPMMLATVLPVFPFIRWAEKRGHAKVAFIGAIILLAPALALAAVEHTRAAALVVAIALFFVGFNYLEGSLPSMISRRAPANQKGAALGIYATAQFLGGGAGAVIGGQALEHWGVAGPFAVAAIIPLIWLLFAIGIVPAPLHDEEPAGDLRA